MHALGARVLAHVVPPLVEHRVWHVQEGEVRLCDMVWHIGFEQVEEEQVGGHVMPRHGMVLHYFAQTSVSPVLA